MNTLFLINIFIMTLVSVETLPISSKLFNFARTFPRNWQRYITKHLSCVVQRKAWQLRMLQVSDIIKWAQDMSQVLLKRTKITKFVEPVHHGNETLKKDIMTHIAPCLPIETYIFWKRVMYFNEQFDISFLVHSEFRVNLTFPVIYLSAPGCRSNRLLVVDGDMLRRRASLEVCGFVAMTQYYSQCPHVTINMRLEVAVTLHVHFLFEVMDPHLFPSMAWEKGFHNKYFSLVSLPVAFFVKPIASLLYFFHLTVEKFAFLSIVVANEYRGCEIFEGPGVSDDALAPTGKTQNRTQYEAKTFQCVIVEQSSRNTSRIPRKVEFAAKVNKALVKHVVMKNGSEMSFLYKPHNIEFLTLVQGNTLSAPHNTFIKVKIVSIKYFGRHSNFSECRDAGLTLYEIVGTNSTEITHFCRTQGKQLMNYNVYSKTNHMVFTLHFYGRFAKQFEVNFSAAVEICEPVLIDPCGNSYNRVRILSLEKGTCLLGHVAWKLRGLSESSSITHQLRRMDFFRFADRICQVGITAKRGQVTHSIVHYQIKGYLKVFRTSHKDESKIFIFKCMVDLL